MSNEFGVLTGRHDEAIADRHGGLVGRDATLRMGGAVLAFALCPASNYEATIRSPNDGTRGPGRRPEGGNYR